MAKKHNRKWNEKGRHRRGIVPSDWLHGFHSKIKRES